MKRTKMPRALATKVARISSFGFVLVIVTFLGLYGGLYLDRITNMAPNFTLIGLILGVVLGFKGFIQEALAARREGT